MKAPAYLPLPPGEGRGEGNNTSWLIPILACLLTTAAHAKTLAVGPGQPFALPSQAVRAAAAGDTILIEPGEYYDCAITEQPLIIEGHGDGVVLTDKTCEGKAILVLRTNGATVRNLTLARARVEDGNGAGIRLEGNGLTIDRVRFVNNEVGILAGGTGRITITDSVFEGGGVGGAHPLAALFLNDGPALVVTRTRFAARRGGQIRSGAALTELRNNTIDTGDEGTGLDILGALVMEDNMLAAGPGVTSVVRVMGAGPVVLRRNRLTNHAGHPVTLLQDWAGGTPVLDHNSVLPGDRETATDGVWRHRASSAFHGAKDGLRSVAGQVKRGLVGLVP